MRVAVVVPYFDADDPAGPEATVSGQHTLRGVIGGLNRRGIDARGFQLHRSRATVQVPGGSIDLAPGVTGSMLLARRLHRLFPRHGPAYYVPAVALWRLVLEWRPHVVHVMGVGLHPNVALARLATAAGHADLVAGFHGGLPPGPGPTKLLSAFGLGAARRVIFTAPELAEPWVEAEIIKPGQIAIAMETSTLLEAEDRETARLRTGLDGDPVCLVVARTDRVKDPLTTVTGFALVAESLPSARLHWFGRAGDLDLVVRAASAALPEVADRIVFHGMREAHRMAEVYSAADYLIQASRREWSGLAVLEAMACGVVPIVSDIPSFHRMTDAGRAGRLFATGDPRGLADALSSVEAHGRALERDRVREHFRKHLSFDALAADLEIIYTSAQGPRALR